MVFVQIRLNRTSQDIFEEFTARAVDLPEIQECYLVSGNFDYLLKARVADMNAYRTLLGGNAADAARRARIDELCRNGAGERIPDVTGACLRHAPSCQSR